MLCFFLSSISLLPLLLLFLFFLLHLFLEGMILGYDIMMLWWWIEAKPEVGVYLNYKWAHAHTYTPRHKMKKVYRHSSQQILCVCMHVWIYAFVNVCASNLLLVCLYLKLCIKIYVCFYIMLLCNKLPQFSKLNQH